MPPRKADSASRGQRTTSDHEILTRDRWADELFERLRWPRCWQSEQTVLLSLISKHRRTVAVTSTHGVHIGQDPARVGRHRPILSRIAQTRYRGPRVGESLRDAHSSDARARLCATPFRHKPGSLPRRLAWDRGPPLASRAREFDVRESRGNSPAVIARRCRVADRTALLAPVHLGGNRL